MKETCGSAGACIQTDFLTELFARLRFQFQPCAFLDLWPNPFTPLSVIPPKCVIIRDVCPFEKGDLRKLAKHLKWASRPVVSAWHIPERNAVRADQSDFYRRWQQLEAPYWREGSTTPGKYSRASREQSKNMSFLPGKVFSVVLWSFNVKI